MSWAMKNHRKRPGDHNLTEKWDSAEKFDRIPILGQESKTMKIAENSRKRRKS
jgi:hypothetical protein